MPPSRSRRARPQQIGEQIDVGDAVGLVVGEPEGEAEPVGVAVPDGVGVADPDAVGEAEELGVDVGVGDGVAAGPVVT